MEQVSWVNRFGQGLSAPFTLGPGEQAFGLLPAGEDAVAVEVQLDPGQSAPVHSPQRGQHVGAEQVRVDAPMPVSHHLSVASVDDMCR